MKRLIVILLFLVALPLSTYLVNHRYFPDRELASTDDNGKSTSSKFDYDLSEASPEEFTKAFKYQVLKNVIPIKGPQGPGLRIGSFLLKNAEGNKVFVCDEYPTIDLIFAAEGVAYSGEIPHMVVRGPCISAVDQKYIEGLPIPFNEILKSPIEKGEFKLMLPDSRDQISIYFKGVTDNWPTEWNWVGLKFYGKNPQNILEINGYEIISVIGKPVILEASPTE